MILTPRWRPDADHYIPDALSRLPRFDQSIFGDFSPDDPSSSDLLSHLGPRAPVLGAALLDHLTPAGVEDDHSE